MTKENIKEKKVSKNGVSIAHIKVSRKDGNIIMNMRLNEDMENIFKRESIATSSVYKSNGEHLKYYKLRSDDESSLHTFEIKYACVLRSYGSGLYSGIVPNFSLIRSVGVSDKDGIKIILDGIISSDSIKNYMQKFKDFLRDFYREFVSDVVVQTELRIQEI